MIGAAGGHTDYAGNEVNALVLGAERPQWEQWIEPSPNSVVIDSVQFYLDGRPSSTHTYYSTQFIEARNRLMVFASSGGFDAFPPAPPGYAYIGSRRSYSFDVGARRWDAPEYVEQYPGSGQNTACLCVKHPWTDDVYYSRNGGDGWYQWHSSDNRWIKRSNETRHTWFAGSAIDPTRSELLVVGSYSPVAPEVRNLNGQLLPVEFRGLGSDALRLSGYPGVLYDEALDLYLVLFNTPKGTVGVMKVDPRTWSVQLASLRGPEPKARPNGLQNAAQYVPELRGLVLANNYNGNVLFMRTAE